MADPVGGPVHTGHQSIRAFFQGSFDACGGGIDFRPEGHISVAGRFGVAAMNARALNPRGPRFHVRSYDVITFDDRGMIKNLNAYYSLSDFYGLP
jgi:hypothetical protein